jgi:hypothetical protein
MTLSNLSFVVFLDPYQGIYDVYLLSSPRYVVFLALGIVTLCLLSLTLHLIALYGSYRWGDSKYILANIYCTVKPWI